MIQPSVAAIGIAALLLLGCAHSQSDDCSFKDIEPSATAVLISASYGTIAPTTPASVGRADIAISPQDGPVVLFLSSMVPTDWHLAILPGAQVEGIFLSGPPESSLFGSPAQTKVIRHPIRTPNAHCLSARIPSFSYAGPQSGRGDSVPDRRAIATLLAGHPVKEIRKQEVGRVTLSHQAWPAVANALIDNTMPPYDQSFVRPKAWGFMQLTMRGDITLSTRSEIVEFWKRGAQGRIETEAAEMHRKASEPPKMAVAKATSIGTVWLVNRSFPLSRMRGIFVVMQRSDAPTVDSDDATLLFMDDFSCAGKNCPQALKVQLAPTPSNFRLGPPAPGFRDPTARDYSLISTRTGEAEAFALRHLVLSETIPSGQ